MFLIQPWLVFAFLAALMWSVVNLLDKVIVIRYVKEQWSRLILDSFVGLSSCIFLLFTNQVSSASLDVILLCMLAGIMLYGFNYSYYKALETADVSVVSTLIQTVPIFTAVWGFLFFEEYFKVPTYIGIILIVLAAISVNVEIDAKGQSILFSGKSWRAGGLRILPGVFIISLNYALQKYILQFSNSWTVFFWGRIGVVIVSMVICLYSHQARHELRTTLTQMNYRGLFLIVFVEWLNLIGIFFIISAYFQGPITLVTSVAAIQPILVIALNILYNIFNKRSLLTDFSNSKKVLFIRALSSLILIIGIFLLS